MMSSSDVIMRWQAGRTGNISWRGSLRVVKKRIEKRRGSLLSWIMMRTEFRRYRWKRSWWRVDGDVASVEWWNWWRIYCWCWRWRWSSFHRLSWTVSASMHVPLTVLWVWVSFFWTPPFFPICSSAPSRFWVCLSAKTHLKTTPPNCTKTAKGELKYQQNKTLL